ncbi:MAG: MaoC/PaaZ C-terminal domain-containing protein [Porticoccaceae bacterium]
MMEKFAHWQTGTVLPPLHLPPLTLDTLKTYAIASGDHAEAHVDPDVARAMGFPHAFAHGLLTMAWLGRLLTDQAPAPLLKSYSVRFTALVFVGEELTCSAVVSGREADAEQVRFELDLQVVNGEGEVKLAGKATVSVPL